MREQLDTRLFNGPVIFHCWYFYTLLSMSLLMPVFVKFYTNSTAKEVWFFIGLWYLFCSLLPVIDPGHDLSGMAKSAHRPSSITVGSSSSVQRWQISRSTRARAVSIGTGLFAIGVALTFFPYQMG